MSRAATPERSLPVDAVEPTGDGTAAAPSTGVRAQVPSGREVANGAGDYVFEPAVLVEEERKPSALKRFVDDLRLLNPSTFATRETRWPLILLSALTTLGAFDSVAFPVMLAYIQTDLGVSLLFLLTLLTVMQLVTMLTGPLVGYIADRVNRVYMVRVGALIESVCIVLTGLAPNVPTLVVSRLAGAIGQGSYQPATQPLLADYFPVQRRARVFGFQTMMLSIWNVIQVPLLVIGVGLTGLLSWRWPLLVMGCVAVVVALLTFRLREPVRGGVDRLTAGATEEQASAEQPPVGWSEAWRTCANIGTLRKLWWATPFVTVAQRSIGFLVYIAFASRGAFSGGSGGGGITGVIFSNSVLARLIPLVLLVGPSLMSVFMTPIALGIADRMIRNNPSRILVYYGVLMGAIGASSAAVLVISNTFVDLAISLPVSALISLIAPAQGLLLSVVIPARVRGQGMQSVQWFAAIGMIMSLPIGAIAIAYGAIPTAIVLLGVLGIGAAILVRSSADVDRDMRNAVAASIADSEAQAARAAGRAKMIVMRHVDVHYDGAHVLKSVDFDVEDGELVALLGTNGAGKSTLLRAIAGLHEASAGAVFLDGIDITHKPAHLNARDGLVFLPGGRAVFPTLTVRENLRAAAWLYRKDDAYVSARTDEVLEFFPVLRDRLDQNAGDMSGGEQQMLALGQAFLMKPRLLMIDELSLGLAPQVVERLLDIVRAIHAQGTTVILVEQSINVALTVAKRAVFLDKGQILFDGPTPQLLGRGDLVKAVFLGGAGAAGFTGAKRQPIVAADATPERVLAVEGLRVDYGGVRALDADFLEVFAGETVGIIGPNGAGKTTLFDAVTGFTRAAEGTVWINSTDATGLPPDARARLGIARSFQDTRLFPSLTVRDTVAVALQRHTSLPNPLFAAAWFPSVRKSERRVYRRVDNVLDALNLGPYADKFINELSTGTRRMVDIACVMAADPTILLLDEPSSGLAQAEVEMLGPTIRRLAGETGCGVLVIEHDIPLVTGMADRLVAMELGKVIATGAPETVLADPAVVSAYLEASEATLRRSGAVSEALAALTFIDSEPRLP